jgi:ribonucleoside-diphosphate reductase alpha chain
MGFQDCLHLMRVPFASPGAVEFADRSMEAVCYHAYWASTGLAEERGRYASFKGSLWDRGILPLDSLKLLAEQRGGFVEVDLSETMDWPALRARIAQHGMRNSNCVAIAPTATISNSTGASTRSAPTAACRSAERLKSSSSSSIQSSSGVRWPPPAWWVRLRISFIPFRTFAS